MGVFPLTFVACGIGLMIEAFVFHFLAQCSERSWNKPPCISASQAPVHGALPGGLQNQSSWELRGGGPLGAQEGMLVCWWFCPSYMACPRGVL